MDGEEKKTYLKDVIRRLGNRLAEEAGPISRDAPAVTGDTVPFHDAGDASMEAGETLDLVDDEGQAVGADTAPFEAPSEAAREDARFAADRDGAAVSDDEDPAVGGDSVPFDDGSGGVPPAGS